MEVGDSLNHFNFLLFCPAEEFLDCSLVVLTICEMWAEKLSVWLRSQWLYLFHQNNEVSRELLRL